ncbi:MAG TPA: O-antigen ligase family protein [Terriglobales bacterium]|jgi:O-antigen ligase|nr:O-antigen ligase family protein [Terriglobales bacterium]
MLESVSEESLLPVNESVSKQNFVRPHVRGQRAKAGFFFLWLFTISVYARPEDIFPLLGQLHLTFVFGLCSGLAYLGALLSGNTRLLWSRELQIVLLLTGWYIAGMPFAFWRGGSFQILINVWLKTLFIFFLLTQTLVTLERIRRVLWAIILSELFVTSFSIIQSSRVVWVGGRMLGVNQGMLGWNFLGIAAAITIPYIAAIFVVHRSLWKTGLLAATFFLMLWMVVLTASRGGLLNVVLSIALTSLLVLRGSSRGKMIGVGIALTLVLAVILAPQVFWQRLGTMWNGPDIYTDQVAASAEESTEDRLAVLSRSIQYTLEHPIFGLGLGNFEVASGNYLGQPSAWMGTHNTFTQISSEAGIPALLLFIGLLATALLNMKRISGAFSKGSEGRELSLMARATLASLLSFVFGAFFAHLAYEYYIFYPVAIAVGTQHAARTMQTLSLTPKGNFVLESQVLVAQES